MTKQEDLKQEAPKRDVEPLDLVRVQNAREPTRTEKNGPTSTNKKK